jgi:hypothetical protein
MKSECIWTESDMQRIVKEHNIRFGLDRQFNTLKSRAPTKTLQQHHESLIHDIRW